MAIATATITHPTIKRITRLGSEVTSTVSRLEGWWSATSVPTRCRGRLVLGLRFSLLAGQRRIPVSAVSSAHTVLTRSRRLIGCSRHSPPRGRPTQPRTGLRSLRMVVSAGVPVVGHAEEPVLHQLRPGHDRALAERRAPNRQPCLGLGPGDKGGDDLLGAHTTAVRPRARGVARPHESVPARGGRRDSPPRPTRHRTCTAQPPPAHRR